MYTATRLECSISQKQCINNASLLHPSTLKRSCLTCCGFAGSLVWQLLKTFSLKGGLGGKGITGRLGIFPSHLIYSMILTLKYLWYRCVGSTKMTLLMKVSKRFPFQETNSPSSDSTRMLLAIHSCWFSNWWSENCKISSNPWLGDKRKVPVNDNSSVHKVLQDPMEETWNKFGISMNKL